MTEAAPTLKEAGQLTASSSEWYTPAVYVEAARSLMGGIDFDPASCVLAQQTVRATAFSSLPENGLTLPRWGRRVWLNPPSPPREWFADLLRRHVVGNGDADQAVYMAYSIEQLSQLQRFVNLGAFCICVPSKRIRYMAPQPDGSLKQGGSPTHASALVGLGFNRDDWERHFSGLGACWGGTIDPREVALEVERCARWKEALG